MSTTMTGWLLSDPGTAVAVGAATLVLVLLLAVITVRIRRDQARPETGYTSRHAAARPGERPGRVDPRVFTPGKASVPGPARFVCPRCGRVSSHPDDIGHGYCGGCHGFTGAQLPTPGEAP